MRRSGREEGSRVSSRLRHLTRPQQTLSLARCQARPPVPGWTTPCAAAPAFSTVVSPDGAVFAGVKGSVFGSETNDGNSGFGLGVGFARDDRVRVFGGGESRPSKSKWLLINRSKFAPSIINWKTPPIRVGSVWIVNKIFGSTAPSP